MERSPTPPPDRVERLDQLQRCARIVLAQAPHDALAVAGTLRLDASPAPLPLAPWGEARAAVLAATGAAPPDGVVLVGAAGFERDWAEAARLGAFLTDRRYFGS
jgi:hypothetical protein